ncbi:hypothetical protein [Photobacterium halotolerans]|uniref:Uncharacterized protein n=1 Tax=Photobacterium halotolerans TaxID=265726 RepID=A0A7X4WE07_9GAMM|nr:hypothetical protein [Photobacterium halotolerans]NAW67014.1 hypothetical protein [Photobacterium halotolerans]
MQQNKSMMPWDLEPAFCKSDIDIVMEKLSKACFDLKDSINKKYMMIIGLSVRKNTVGL